MKKTKGKASIFLLTLIILLLAIGIIYTLTVFNSGSSGDSLSGDQVIYTLFVIDNGGRPLSTYVLMYYPTTRRAAIFDIPGSLGLIIRQINRVDRIDTLYDFQRNSSFEAEVARLLGIDITFSVILTLENLGKIVDLIEGVDVFIPVPVDVYQDELVLFPSGLTRLDGDKAKMYLSYELPGENSDMGVHRRQRFFLSFLRRLGEKNEDLKNPQVSELYRSFMKTNMNSRIHTRLFDTLSYIEIDRINMQSVGGNLREVSGQTLLFPHWDGSLIRDIVRQSLVNLIDNSYDDRTFTVEVLNGTAVTGLAGRTAELLRNFGYNIISIGNADHNNYQRTFIVTSSEMEDRARAFGEIIRCRDIRTETFLQNQENRADFTLVLGRDFNERFVTGN